METVFVYNFLHASHRGFAESIGARLWYYHNHFNYRWLPRIVKSFFNGLLLPRSGLYLCEGGAPLGPAVVRKLFCRRVKVVELIAEETFLMIGATPTEMRGSFPAHVNLFHRIEARFVDGAIAVSDFAKESASGLIRGPVRVALPYIEDGRYESLQRVIPNLDSHDIVSISTCVRPMKGMDMLIEAHKIVRCVFPDSRLFVLGQGYPEQWHKTDGVIFVGYVDDLEPYLERASLYVQASRGDMFSVATVESLIAGVPAIVTELTGSKEVVANLGNEFVKLANPADIAEGILYYFNLPSSTRQELSSKARQLATPFRRQEMCARFAEQFSRLLQDMGIEHAHSRE